jgi:hypothetical protein
MNYPLINILIRTSNRPGYFDNCYRGIRGQSYKNVRLIVSFDSDGTFNYVRKYPVEALVGVKKNGKWQKRPIKQLFDGTCRKPFYPNLYLNKMMRHVHPGYILILDDDNMFSDKGSLGYIAESITNGHQILFWKVQFPGFTVPKNFEYGRPPRPRQVDSSGFCFSTGYVNNAIWDGYTYGGYQVANRLFKAVPDVVYINEALTSLQGAPGHGGQLDLSTSKQTCDEI